MKGIRPRFGNQAHLAQAAPEPIARSQSVSEQDLQLAASVKVDDEDELTFPGKFSG